MDLFPWICIDAVIILFGWRVAATRTLDLYTRSHRIDASGKEIEESDIGLTGLRALNYGLFVIFVGLLMDWFALYILVEERYDLLERQLFVNVNVIALVLVAVMLPFALFVEAVTKHYETNAPRKRKHSDAVHPLERPPSADDAGVGGEESGPTDRR